MVNNNSDSCNIGVLLKEAREYANLSCASIANQLHLTSDVIEKIENNDFSHAAPAFMCGYIRSYAKIVRIPQEQISEMITTLGLVDGNYKSAQPAPKEFTKQKIKRSWNKVILYVVLVVILIALSFVWHYFANKQPVNVELKETTSTPIVKPLDPLAQKIPKPSNSPSDATFSAALPEQGLE